MLSPGKAWEIAPKGRVENLRWRKYLRGRANASKMAREKIIDNCAHDVLYYINAFGCTFNPKGEESPKGNKSRVLPFVTYPFQDRALKKIIWAIDKQRDLVIEKSREQGASILCVCAIEWLWHFEKWTESLLLSRDWNLVDGKTPDSLMWKIDFLHKWMPPWLMPKGWEPDKHRLKGYFENPETHSTITGQSTTEKSGIGGRDTVILLDEFSRMDNAMQIRDGTADVSDCRIFNSTHTGPGSTFHGLCTNGVTEKLVMHWTEHPIKSKGAYRYDPEVGRVVPLDGNFEYPVDFNFVLDGSPAGGPFPGIRSPWYDYECERRGSTRAIAMDLDIDVAGSTELVVDPLLVRRLVGESCCDPYWQGNILFDRDTGRPQGLVASPGGPLKLWVAILPNGKPPAMEVVIGGDLSSGSGATPSCLGGIDIRKGEKILEYTNANIDPKAMAFVAAALAWFFCDETEHPAQLIWEQQGPGIVFGGQILELGFRNVFYRTAELPHSMEMKVSQRPGWVPTKETLDVLILEYISALSLRQFTNRSRIALEELLAFKYGPDGHIEHSSSKATENMSGQRVNHGDHVIADALAWKLAKGKGSKGVVKREEKILEGSLAWRRQLRKNAEKDEEVWL